MEKSRAAIERKNIIRVKDEEEESSSSSMSMYNLDSDEEDLDMPSRQSPTVIVHDAPFSMHLEEVHSSPVMEKIMFERHSMIQEEEHSSSYNIEEIFDAFTFNLYKKEVHRKRIQNVKQNDRTMKEIHEDEVLFEKTDEDLVTVATSSTTLSQATAHNVTMLNEKLSQAESENIKLKDEIISLREEMNKRRKVENDMIPLKENIFEQQEQLHDVKVECFTKI